MNVIGVKGFDAVSVSAQRCRPETRDAHGCAGYVHRWCLLAVPEGGTNLVTVSPQAMVPSSCLAHFATDEWGGLRAGRPPVVVATRPSPGDGLKEGPGVPDGLGTGDRLLHVNDDNPLRTTRRRLGDRVQPPTRSLNLVRGCLCGRLVREVQVVHPMARDAQVARSPEFTQKPIVERMTSLRRHAPVPPKERHDSRMPVIGAEPEKPRRWVPSSALAARTTQASDQRTGPVNGLSEWCAMSAGQPRSSDDVTRRACGR